MGDAHYIVERLREPPFNVNVDLIGLSEKSPQQLLELLGHVCGIISPKHASPEVGGPESFDAVLRRVLAFLRVVKYRPPQQDTASFQQQLAVGDRDAVHTALRWLLAQEPMLRKRAFVGYYLTMPEVPEDLAYDPSVADLTAAIKELHPAFIEAHKAAEAARATAGNAAALRSQVKELEAEKERLREKVAAARARVTGLPHAEAYAGICTALRQQHDEEEAISDAFAAQAQAHARAEAAAARAEAALAAKAGELEGGADGGDSGVMVARLQAEVVRLRQQVDERAPREIEARQRRLAVLREALAIEVGGEAGLQRVAAHASALQQSVAEASTRLAAAEKARQADRSYLQVRQAQQMAAVVAKRRSELEARLDRLARAREALLVALGGDAAGSGGRDGGSISDADWQAKFEAVKAQVGPVKHMKKELAALEAEAAVLARTEALLAAQAGEPSGGQGEGGVSGQQGVGGTEDLATLRAAVASRKAELAPKVQELRAARENLQAAESRLAAAREAHTAAVGPLEVWCAALEAEVAGLEAEEKGARTAAAEAEAAAAALGDSLARLAAEAGGSPERLRERSEHRVAQAEAELRALREQQKGLAAAAARAHSQRAVFEDLARLLRAKMRAAEGAEGEDPQGGGGRGGYGGSAAANVAVF